MLNMHVFICIKQWNRVCVYP